jgi:hypothetical protein
MHNVSLISPHPSFGKIDIHQVPYRSYLPNQFSSAYDVYLEINRRVDQQLKAALGQDTPDWRLHNICPPCFYKLKDEPTLRFSFLSTMDGNNSLKRLGEDLRKVKERTDSRVIKSDRWLSPEYVDRFKDEVKHRSASDALSCAVNTSFFVLYQRFRKNMMMTGRMWRNRAWTALTTVSNAGGMLDQTRARKCTLFLSRVESSLRLAATALSSWSAI